MNKLVFAFMATLLSTPAFAQATALPRAPFDPILVDRIGDAQTPIWADAFGGSPEVNMKEYCLKSMENWYWHLHNPKFDKHGYIPRGMTVDNSDINSNPPSNMGPH